MRGALQYLELIKEKVFMIRAWFDSFLLVNMKDHPSSALWEKNNHIGMLS